MDMPILDLQASLKLLKLVHPFLIPKNVGFDTKLKSVACPEVELLLHEEVYYLLREGDPVINTQVNIVVHKKNRDHAKFQQKKVVAKKT